MPWCSRPLCDTVRAGAQQRSDNAQVFDICSSADPSRSDPWCSRVKCRVIPAGQGAPCQDSPGRSTPRLPPAPSQLCVCEAPRCAVFGSGSHLGSRHRCAQGPTLCPGSVLGPRRPERGVPQGTPTPDARPTTMRGLQVGPKPRGPWKWPGFGSAFRVSGPSSTSPPFLCWSPCAPCARGLVFALWAVNAHPVSHLKCWLVSSGHRLHCLLWIKS